MIESKFRRNMIENKSPGLSTIINAELAHWIYNKPV
jgi:hypothetical protein